MGFYMAYCVSTRLTGKFARHGELNFLPQWVSATSGLRGLDRLTRLPSNLLAMASKHVLLPISC